MALLVRTNMSTVIHNDRNCVCISGLLPLQFSHHCLLSLRHETVARQFLQHSDALPVCCVDGIFLGIPGIHFAVLASEGSLQVKVFGIFKRCNPMPNHERFILQETA